MQRRNLKIKAKGLQIGARALQIGAAFGITNWTKVGLQIGAAFQITNWGKKITNRGRDYKSVQNNSFASPFPSQKQGPKIPPRSGLKYKCKNITNKKVTLCHLSFVQAFPLDFIF